MPIRRRHLLLSGPAPRCPAWPSRRPATIPTGRSRSSCRSPPAAGPTSWRARWRKLAEALGKGAVVVVDNIVGAGGILAAQNVARMAPDGYNLLFGASSHVVQKAMQPSVMFDPRQGLHPHHAHRHQPVGAGGRRRPRRTRRWTTCRRGESRAGQAQLRAPAASAARRTCVRRRWSCTAKPRRRARAVQGLGGDRAVDHRRRHAVRVPDRVDRDRRRCRAARSARWRSPARSACPRCPTCRRWSRRSRRPNSRSTPGSACGHRPARRRAGRRHAVQGAWSRPTRTGALRADTRGRRIAGRVERVAGGVHGFIEAETLKFEKIVKAAKLSTGN